jgi:glycosyltransferase involved in cell wall biosynthesis
LPELRLLVVTHYYSTHLGGIEIIAEEVARRLGSTHAVVWAASDCDPVPATDRITYAPMRVANAVERLCGVPLPLWGPQSCARLWRLVGTSDAVHLHDFAYMGNVVAFLAARWFGKPVVVTQHIGVVPYRSGLLRFLQRMAHATLGRLVLGGARQVVFYSDVVRRYYDGFIRFRQPPVMLANGVDTDTFAAAAAGDRARARGALGLDPGKPVALFVGRFVEKKGLHILEALARRTPDVSWVLAGWGPIDPRRWGAPNVHVHDNRKGRDLVPLYHAADLLVLPSVGEGLPLVVQEALSCGTPVIVGDDTAAAVQAPAAVVFSCPVTPEAQTIDVWEQRLREALTTVRGNAGRSVEAAAFARATWSWSACASSYAAVLRASLPANTDS